MAAETKDNIATIAAIGLLAYASADIAHHAFGHGGTCLALGGSIVSLSSIYVDCTLRGAAIDLAGPFANLAFGLIALSIARIAPRSSSTTRSPATRLFWILVAAFNLLWFALQLVFSAATRTDDWAWPMQQFHIAEPIRYGMIAAGALMYLWAMRAIAALMAPFAHPAARAKTIVLTAWIASGAIACATAAFDHDAIPAILHHALPQSLALSIGLLFVPATAANSSSPSEPAHALAFSIPWTIAAVVVGVASIVLLGSGIAI